MKYERFEQLPVWVAAIESAAQVYKLTCEPVFLRERTLRDQIERAAISISFANLKFEISNLKLRCEEISRQLRGWAQSLQESSIKGQRFLNAKSRGLDKAQRNREQLLEELRRIQAGA